VAEVVKGPIPLAGVLCSLALKSSTTTAIQAATISTLPLLNLCMLHSLENTLN